MGAGVIAKGDKGGRRGRRRRSRPMAEINVTPFVDVMLVLLIIFMVAAPMLTVGVSISLPKTAAPPMNVDVNPLKVIIDADGSLLINDTEIPPAEFEAKLRAIAAQRDSTKVYFYADKAVSNGWVQQVLGALSSGGFPDISMAHDPGGLTLDESGG